MMHRVLPILAICMALLAAGATSATGAGSPRTFSVWLPYWSLASAETSALTHADQIQVASPFWYSVSADAAVSADPGAGDPAVIGALRSRGLSVVPTVTESTGLRGFERMLASAAARAALVRALVMIASQSGYAGLDLDFEQFAVDPDREVATADAAAIGYPVLIGEVCAALHAIGRTCTVTVMPRTTAAKVLWRHRLATRVYDYRSLAAVADRIRIMAYDDHAPDSSAGPVAPLTWVEQVIAFARSQMPAAKAELGLAAYGYQWGPSGASIFTDTQAEQRAAAAGARPAWSRSAGEEYFAAGSPGHRITAWFENTRAELIRTQLALAAGFSGVVLWAAGDETPDLWTGAAGL